MSILAHVSPTTAPSVAEGALTLLMLISIAVAPIAAWRMGVFRRDGIQGPVRVGSDMPIMPLLLVTLIGGFIWIAAQVIYVAARAAMYARAHPKQSFDTSQLTDKDFAFLATVPFVIGLLVLIVGDALPKNPLARPIGYVPRNIAAGIGKAMLAMIVVLPMVWAASFTLEIFYRVIHYTHPGEHELLGAMKDASPGIRVLLIFAACVLAPIFEEFLFRGHLQTLLVRFLTREPKPGFPALMTTQADDAVAMPAAPLPMPLLDDNGPELTRMRWVAVLITSLIFAAFHPLWMAPLIFVLALCLGYAYERTGNLWVTIAMHAMFNACNTLIFFNFK